MGRRGVSISKYKLGRRKEVGAISLRTHFFCLVLRFRFKIKHHVIIIMFRYTALARKT